MDKDEYNHFHSYQDRIDAFDERLTALSVNLHKDMWSNSQSILDAIPEALGESIDYAAIIKYCYKNNSTTLLGAITLELIDLQLSQLSDELAEDKLT